MSQPMIADLRRWTAQIQAADVTVDSLAAAIGEIISGAGTTQVVVRPADAAWSTAEIIERPGEGPSFVRLVPAEGRELPLPEIEGVFGDPSTVPPKIHFTDPERRIYEVDDGQPAHTAAVIADLAEDGPVIAVTIRRDIRL